MVQLSLYDYVGKEKDPIFLLISKLKENETMAINEFEVKKNQFGKYEIENEDTHEVTPTLDDCYKFIVNNTENEILY